MHQADDSNPQDRLWPPTWPMGLTLLRILLLPLFLWLILSDAHTHDPAHVKGWLALAVFALMAITDKLDGYLARRLNQISRIGTILDPVADKLLVASSVILLSFDWVASERYSIPSLVVGIIYGGYFVVAVGTLIIFRVRGKVPIVARPLGKSNTVLQLLLVILTLFAVDLGTERGEHFHATLVALWYLVPIVACATCADYILQGIKYLTESKPQVAAL